MSDSGHVIGEKNPYHPNFRGRLIDEIAFRDHLIDELKQQVATLTAERDEALRCLRRCSVAAIDLSRSLTVESQPEAWLLEAMAKPLDAADMVNDRIADLEAINAKLVEAAKAVLDWYDRDGSVGGACDPMEQLTEAIGGE